MEKIFLLGLLIFLLGLGFVSGECLDTDGGFDYFNKGIINSEKEDYCPIDKGESQYEKKLVEYYCRGSEVRDFIYWCEDRCEDGACVEDPKEFGCPSYGTLSLLNNNQAIYFKNRKYIANPTYESREGKEGINIYVDGILYESGQDSISIGEEVILKFGGVSGHSAVPTEVKYCFEESQTNQYSEQISAEEELNTLSRVEQGVKNKNIYYIIGGIILVVIIIGSFWLKKK